MPFLHIFGTKEPPSLFARLGRREPLVNLGIAIGSHRPLMVTLEWEIESKNSGIEFWLLNYWNYTCTVQCTPSIYDFNVRHFLQLKDRWHNLLLCLSFQVCQCWWPTPFFTTQESTLWTVAHLTSRCLSALRTGSWAAATSQTTTPPQGYPTPFSPWSSSLVYPLSSSRPSTYQYTDTSKNTGQSSNENPLHRYSLLLNCQHTRAY